MYSSYPIVVIGGGPAGSVAATLLAHSGVPVILLEQHRFPRDKVCGECLSATGLDVLERLDTSGLLQRLGAVTLHRTLIHACDGSSLCHPLRRPMCGISRLSLDTMLLELARGSGAHVMQPARCERIFTAPTAPPRVIVRDLVSNQQQVIEARLVIVADGKGAVLPERPRATGDLGIKAHFAHVSGPRDAIELFGVRGHYGGLAPIEHDRWNASFSVPARLVQTFRGDLDRLFAAITHGNDALRARMRTARRVGPWLASPLPRFAVSRHWPNGIIPLGNAAAAIEPVGGEGMGLAMRSAELAADAIVASGRANRAASSDPASSNARSSTAGIPLDTKRLRNQFAALWRPRSAACRALALAISSPRFARWAIPLISSSDPPARLAMRMIGK